MTYRKVLRVEEVLSLNFLQVSDPHMISIEGEGLESTLLPK